MVKRCLGLLISLCALSCYAANDSFLNYSPVYYFTDKDWAISQDAAKKALDSGQSNQKISWSNPASGAKGYFIPSAFFNFQGMKCRRLTIFNEARGVTGEATYKFCKVGQEWKTI